uniref:Sulfhydryl oxidase n=1 Tax=Hemiselmis andersenii TaxID=464988 RepID=A0A7S0U110_HEMAN|mmetsp:Transcript_3078/g.7499  ORF Transcript_3078/g.7499 Transcript_3078/m.7499 type:complete len:633 (+) Transcript_3078:19-1917(+)
MMRLTALVVLALCLAGRAQACGDAICHTYGDEPRFDDSDRPPNAVVLGRATWTVMHTTAAYLKPGDLTPLEIQSFKTLVTTMPRLYPGKGKELIAKIFADETIQKDLEAVKTGEDCQLWIWKVHNALSAVVHPSRTPFPESLGLHVSQFRVANPESGDTQYDLSGASDVQKKMITKAVKARWVIAGGLENHPWTKRDMLNLPPDRTMLGRAFWTYMHTLSVYLPHTLEDGDIESFKGLFDVIHNIYACPVCKHHFGLFYNDPVLKKEHDTIETKHEAIMYLWKIHNIVTADGIFRKEWPNRKLFPHSKHFNVSQFHIPAPDADKKQMRTEACPNGGPTTTTCLGANKHFEVIADVESRWQIEGGIDQPLVDKAPAPCPAPVKGQKILKMDMYIMGKCPWCGKAMERIADTIKCDYTCKHHGQDLTARLNFEVHMVGLNNGTWAHPWLRAIHGPSELVGERLGLCARQHYSKEYKYVKFIQCMDQNVSTIPIRAPECAEKNGMDLDLLVACANTEGEQLVATSYGFASWMGIDITPTFVLNDKKKVLGLPDNFTDIVCEQLATTSVALAEVGAESGAGGGRVGKGSSLEDLMVTGVVVAFATLMVAGLAAVAMRLRGRKEGGEEKKSLLDHRL